MLSFLFWEKGVCCAGRDRGSLLWRIFSVRLLWDA